MPIPPRGSAPHRSPVLSLRPGLARRAGLTPRAGRLAAGGLAALLAVASPAAGHEDDGKLLDRRPPVRAAAFAPGRLLRAPSAVGAGVSMLSGALPPPPLGFPRENVTLLAWLPIEELGGVANANDCWGYVSPSGREYALVGLANGTAIVEVTDPSAPVLVAHVAGPGSLWRDVKTYDHYAYAVSEGGGGIQVIDLGAVDQGQVQLVDTVTSGGVTSTHNVAIDEASGLLARCGGASGTGLRLYSLANPAHPVFVGSWSERYVHDAQLVTYDAGPLAGHTLAFCCSGFGNGSVSTGLTVVDVTNPAAPYTRAQLNYPGGAYSHQGWLSPDRSLFYLGDELDENGVKPTTTYVIDVADPDQPAVLGTFTNGNRSIGHNLYTLGNRLFEANYRSGLRVFDVSSPLAAVEIASFDVWPANDADHFNGLWSCYPYLPSGIVLGSDLEKGLFVWWVGDPEVAVRPIGGAPALLDPAGASLLVEIEGAVPGSEVLWLDDGAGGQTLPLAPLGGALYRADFPPLPCDAEVAWAVGARGASGALWTAPEGAPYLAYRSLAARAQRVAFHDDAEADRGWTFGWPDDTATAGVWTRGVPEPIGAQPGEDATPGAGTRCFFTGADSDVDGGATSLVSPPIDLGGFSDPVLSLRLYLAREGNATPSDGLRIQWSADDGASWSDLDLVTSPPSRERGVWTHRSWPLAGVVPAAPVRLRFRARDVNLDSEIEVALDDILVREAVCDCSGPNAPPECACAAVPGCPGAVNSTGAAGTLSASGTPSLAANDLVLVAEHLPPGEFALFFYGGASTAVPFGEGTLCVAGGAMGLQRLWPPAPIDASGVAARALDLLAPPAAAGPGAIGAGTTIHAQAWYRDPAGGPAGFDLTGSLAIPWCP